MYTLFLDTHDKLITISFINEKKEITRSIESESHSTAFLPLLETMMKENSVELKQISKIIAINGPGSFTGIRIGLTIAKTLSYCLDIPIYTLSSLKAYLISSDIDNKMCVIEDPKGYYIATNDLEVYDTVLDEYKNFTIVENKLDIKKIFEYCKGIKPTNVHLVKANYVKIIEVLK